MIALGGNRKRTDQEIIEGILKGGKEEEICLKQLYKENQRPIMSFILKNSGNTDESKEILQMGIVVLYEKIKERNFTLTSKLSTYLFSVVKNLWYTRLKEYNKEIHAEPFLEKEESDFQEEVMLETKDFSIEKASFVAKLMENLKEDCQEVLQLSIYQNYSMKEIADLMGFKNEQIARNKKSKCLGYFKKMILEDEIARKIVLS